MPIKLKNALKEIFEAKMVVGEPLHDYCDDILMSSYQSIPKDVLKFIVLGNYRASDVLVGDLRDKFRIYSIEIGCASVVDYKNSTPEETAENQSEVISKLVRTILKNNRTLISSTYPDGVAKGSNLIGDYLEFVNYDEAVCSINHIQLEAKIIEDDEDEYLS